VKRRLLWIVGIVVAAGLLTGGYLYTQGIGARPAFRTATVTRGPLTSAVSATGTLNAVITVLVGSQVSGQVKDLYADFNSLVKKNQVIARIDPESFEAKVNQSKAQVDAARASVLNQQAVVEKTRADLENARAALAASKANTAKTQVTVLDSKRTLGRNRDLRERGLIAQADEDTAQAAYDSAVALQAASKAQEEAQVSAVRAAEAQLRVSEAMLQNARAQVVQNEAALRQAQVDLALHQDHLERAAREERAVQDPHPAKVRLSDLDRAARERALAIAARQAQLEDALGGEQGQQDQIGRHHSSRTSSEQNPGPIASSRPRVLGAGRSASASASTNSTEALDRLPTFARCCQERASASGRSESADSIASSTFGPPG